MTIYSCQHHECTIDQQGETLKIPQVLTQNKVWNAHNLDKFHLQMFTGLSAATKIKLPVLINTFLVSIIIPTWQRILGEWLAILIQNFQIRTSKCTWGIIFLLTESAEASLSSTNTRIIQKVVVPGHALQVNTTQLDGKGDAILVQHTTPNTCVSFL